MQLFLHKQLVYIKHHLAMRSALLALLFSVITVCSYAQGFPPATQEKGDEKPGGDKKESITSKADTTTLRYHSYRINNNNHKESIPLDTVFNGAQIYSRLQQHSPSWTRGTSYGQAAISNEYFKRDRQAEFLFWQPYNYYWTPNEDWQYYKLNTPYTDVYFSKAQKSSGYEQLVGVNHARNFSDRFNTAIQYNVISTPGILGHRNRSRHANFATQASYTGLRYQVHANFTRTHIEGNLNGGFAGNDYFFDNDSLTERVNVSTASDELKRFVFYADQEFLIGPVDSVKTTDKNVRKTIKAWASIRHRLKINSSYRAFRDEELSYTENTNGKQSLDFYAGAFYNRENTYDSVYFRQITNHAEIEIKEGFVPNVNFGLRFGLKHELNKVYNFKDYIFLDRNEENYHSMATTATVFNRVSDYWSWQANGDIFLSGYKQGDMKLDGELKRFFFVQNDSSILSINASTSRRRPDFFINKYYSNHYVWVNNFEKTERYSASLHYENPKWRFKIGTNAEQIKNYVYFNEIGMPTQDNSGFLIWSAYLKKTLNWGPIVFDNYLSYQYVANEALLHLPSWISSQSLYLDKVMFNDAIRLQLGVDFRMTDKFYADYFNPATGMFQLQNQQEVGLFPVVDAFLNIRLRTARLFFKYSNLYQNLGETWFLTSAYTVDSPAMFRMGVYWFFKN